MRTTVTIDQDLAAQIKRVMRERGISFKEALNSILRIGLGVETKASRPYVLAARDLGLRPDIDLDKALSIAAGLEDEQVIRKLEVRK